jgi:hypothetical protein
MTTRTYAAVLSLVIVGLTGCGESSPRTSPIATGPSPVVAVSPPIEGGQAIAGTVYDSAYRPLSGARVELLDGPQAGLATTTDSIGSFGFFANIDDATRFRASKDGHVTREATIGPYCAPCKPNRWVHFVLNLVDSPVPLAGDYDLTFIADSTCANLPAELRTRRYDVTIAGSPAGSDTSLKVTPKGPAFPDGLNYFSLNVAGNYVAVFLGDHTDPGVTERVAEHTYFAFGGWAAVSLEPPVATISTPFQGWIDSCVNPNMGQRYDCTPSAAVTRTRCDSARHQLILTRK